MLVLHYIEHKELNSKETLFDFMHAHYADCDNHNNDKEHKHQLPFKSHEGCVNLNILIGLPTCSENLFQKPEADHDTELLAAIPQFISSAYLASIWQPPKFS